MFTYFVYVELRIFDREHEHSPHNVKGVPAVKLELM